MRERIREIEGLFARASGIAWLVRQVTLHKALILYYHRPSAAVLRSHLRYLRKRFAILPLSDVTEALAAGELSRLPPRPLAITLDDGWRENAELAEVVRAFRVRPTIYLTTAIVGTRRPFWFEHPVAVALGKEQLKQEANRTRLARMAAAGYDPVTEAAAPLALSWEEARAMADAFEFGAHTRTHPILPGCDDDECRSEIAGSRHDVEANLGTPCRHFAYPNGDYGEREAAMVRDAGFASGRTVEPGWNDTATDPFRLKAISIADDTSVNVLASEICGIAHFRRRLLRWLRRRATMVRAV